MFDHHIIQAIMKIPDRLKFSGLKIPQIINKIKALVAYVLDYNMINSVMNKTH
jgi:hypothetical protein